MNFIVLQYYCTVCEAGSVARAAELLHISRQALSKSMLVLESEMGAKLFIKGKKGVEMTPFGKALYQHSQVLLQDWKKATAELEKLKSSSKERLRIGYAPLSYNLWDNGHVESFANAHFDVEISYEIMRPAQLMQHLKDGSLDLIISGGYADSDGTFSVLLRCLPYYLILRNDDPLAQKAEIGAEDLTGRPVFSRPIAGLSTKDKEAFGQAGIIVLPLPSPSLDPLTMLRTIRDIKGIYFDSKLHFLYRNMMDGLTAIPFRYEGTMEMETDKVWAIVRKGQQNDSLVRQYIYYLSELRSELTSAI